MNENMNNDKQASHAQRTEQVDHAKCTSEDVNNAIEAAVLRRLLTHLRAHSDVQNIDLMILANFCRNCLAKWYTAAAHEHGVCVSDAEAREHIYGMPFAKWKEKYQKQATPEQQAAYQARTDVQKD